MHQRSVLAFMWTEPFHFNTARNISIDCTSLIVNERHFAKQTCKAVCDGYPVGISQAHYIDFRRDCGKHLGQAWFRKIPQQGLSAFYLGWKWLGYMFFKFLCFLNSSDSFVKVFSDCSSVTITFHKTSS